MMAMSNKSYASYAMKVPNGVLNIKQEGMVTYKHIGIGETEIKDYSGQPVKMPQEILYHIPNSKGGEKSLRFSYIVKDQEIDQRSLTNSENGVLFTGKNTKIKINAKITELHSETCKKVSELFEKAYHIDGDYCEPISEEAKEKYEKSVKLEWGEYKETVEKFSEDNKVIVRPTERDSMFAMIGVDLMNDPVLFNSHGITDIDTNYIFFVGNRVHYRQEWKAIHLFSGGRTTNIGSANTKLLLVSDILSENYGSCNPLTKDLQTMKELINSKNSLFHSRTEFLMKLDGEYIIIRNSNSKVFNNDGTMIVGSEITKVLSITGIKGEYISDLVFNWVNSDINFNGRIISITNNDIPAKFTFIDAKEKDRRELLELSFVPKKNKEEEYKQFSLIRNWGTININLFGNSPCFTLAGNTVQKYNGDKKERYSDKDIIGIAMLTQGLFFERNLPPKLVITNNADTIATVIFGHDVRSFYDGGCNYMNHADINSILIIRGNGKNNDTNNPIKIEEKSKPSKNSVGIGNEEDMGLTSFIPIGSGVGSAFLVSGSVHINDNNNYNDNFTFSHTNNNNNNEEEDKENNKPRGSYIRTMLGNNMLEFNKVLIERGDIVIFITLNGKGLVGVGKDSELNVDESSRIFIEIDEPIIKANSKHIITISKFKNIADEVKKRIFLGPISKSKGFLGFFVGNDFIISTAMPTIEINNNNDDDDDYNEEEEKDSKEKTDDNCLIQ